MYQTMDKISLEHRSKHTNQKTDCTLNPETKGKLRKRTCPQKGIPKKRVYVFQKATEEKRSNRSYTCIPNQYHDNMSSFNSSNTNPFTIYMNTHINKTLVSILLKPKTRIICFSHSSQKNRAIRNAEARFKKRPQMYFQTREV